MARRSPRAFGFIGFNGKKKVDMRRCEEMTMWCSSVWCIVTLTLSLLAAPRAAGAQQAGQVARGGYLVSSPITPG